MAIRAAKHGWIEIHGVRESVKTEVLDKYQNYS